MWVYNEDADSWRLWIVPGPEINDKFQFYRRLAEIVADNRNVLGDLDASSTQFMSESHPALVGLARFARVEGVSAIRLSNNMLNGYYLPDAVIIRMVL